MILEITDSVESLLAGIKSGEVKLSYSSLSKFRESPKSFINYKMQPKTITPSQELGNIVHAMILEPEKVADKYITDEKIVEKLISEGAKSPRATTKYKEWKEGQTAEILSSDVYYQAEIMAKSVLNNSAASAKLAMITKSEVKFEFDHEGLKFIGYYDGIDDDSYRLIIDIKTCSDANPDVFRRELIKQNYWFQAGVYCYPLGTPIPYYLIAVDKSGGVSVNQLGEDLIEFGMETFDKTVLDFKKCMEQDDFGKSFEYRSVSPDGTFMCARPPYLV